MRGGEKVLDALSELFPEAPIFTLFANRKHLSSRLMLRQIHTSFLQKIPGISKWYRWLLPLFPLAIQSMNVKDYDLVISSSHCVAKAVRTGPHAIHLCYCHSPMRYLWEFKEEYLGRFPRFFRVVIGFYFKWLQRWDVATAQRVSYFIANSKHIARKIARFYDRQATVIHPPVEAHVPKEPKPGLYYLIISALVPYKKIDIAVQAFNRLKKPLRIVGEGPLRAKLERMVAFENVVFEGWLDDNELSDRYRNAKAVIFPGEEDFGIVPVEAQLFGKPVIAYGKGGVTETVLACNDGAHPRRTEESTGLFFYSQDIAELVRSVEMFEQLKFDSAYIQQHAESFNRERFLRDTEAFIRHLLSTASSRGASSRG